MIRLTGLVSLKPVHSLKEEGEKKWIQKAIEKPGALHKQLGVPAGEKIPAEKLKTAAEKGGKLGKRARLAMTLRKLHEEYELSEEASNKINELEEHILNEYMDEEETEEPSNIGDHEGSMAKAQLLNLHKQAGELYNMVGENEGLEAWVQDKLGRAADYINVVYNFMQYNKNKPSSIGSGEGTPADTTPEGEVNRQYAESVKPCEGCESEEVVKETSPEGWEGTVKAMKKYKNRIDNPWALAYYMKKKGYKTHKRGE